MADKTAILLKHDVPEPLRAIVLDAYRVFSDRSESAKPDNWALSGDDYYDFLESWTVGHRRLKPWVRERMVGATVTLTAKGVALLSELEAARPTPAMNAK